jgi:hypothetical protein
MMPMETTTDAMEECGIDCDVGDKDNQGITWREEKKKEGTMEQANQQGGFHVQLSHIS